MPSPVTTAAPAAPTPQLDVPFPLEPVEVDTRLVPDEDPEGVSAPFIVDREAREVRRWAGAHAITPSPFADVVLATVGGGPSDPGATALLDLSTGVVEGLLPVGSAVLQWPAPDRVFLLIDPLTFGRPPTWLAGIYELDLAARTIELVSRGGGGRMLSPDGTMTLAVANGAPGPRVVVRDLAGGTDVYTYDPNRSAVAGRVDVWSARWLEDGRVALSLGGGRVVLADPRSGVEAVYESSTPGLSLFDASPDGRVIPATSFFGEYGNPELGGEGC